MTAVNTTSNPGTAAVAVTPNDSTDLARPARAFYVGVSGDLRINDLEGTDVTFENVPVGVFDVGGTRVYSTNTTASSIVAIF